jgi:hypothetical protein
MVVFHIQFLIFLTVFLIHHQIIAFVRIFQDQVNSKQGNFQKNSFFFLSKYSLLFQHSLYELQDNVVLLVRVLLRFVLYYNVVHQFSQLHLYHNRLDQVRIYPQSQFVLTNILKNVFLCKAISQKYSILINKLLKILTCFLALTYRVIISWTHRCIPIWSSLSN